MPKHLLLLIFSVLAASASSDVSLDVPIQAAIDAKPGQMVFVPEGAYIIKTAVHITHDGGGLYGPGRIIQQNPEAPVLLIDGVKDVRVEGLTLVRPAEGKGASASAVRVQGSERVSLADLQVLDNRAQMPAISIEDSSDCEIRNCTVRNYTRIGIDDRVASEHYGYAFNCIDGTGIAVSRCTGTLIQGNRIVEERLWPTQEVKERYRLGSFTARAEQKGSLVPQETWEAGYVNNWHQGSALIVTGPKASSYTRILGNHIAHAAQGIDIHADHVIISQNVVVDAFMGMKAMHGSRNVLILGNQFVKNDLWSIGLMPGAASDEANIDGGHIVANNIVSDFGHGKSNWIWEGEDRHPIMLVRGQEPDDPPLRDVVITGNIVSSEGPPRYRYALYVEQDQAAQTGRPAPPENVHVSDNLLQPGTDGASNIP